MHCFASLLALSVVVIATATAQSTIVIPSGLAGVEGNSSNAFPWGRTGTGLRHQAIYDSSHFTGQGINTPILITGLKWRPNANVALVASSYTVGCTVSLSTCPVDQSAVTTTFASNQGADLTTCYSGVVSWGAQPTGPGPRPFGISIPLTTPFVYDPSAGDLNIESDLPIQPFTGSGPQLDVQSTGALASRVFLSTGYVNGGPNATTTFAVGQNHGVVVEVSYCHLLTTTYANNNSGGVGGGVYFDVDVTNPAGVTMNGLDVNLVSAATTPGTIEVYTCPATRTGNQTNAGAWTLVSSGTVTSAGPGVPSRVTLANPVSLSFGTVGMALRAVGLAHAYTNGTGSNQVISNSDLTLNCGEASNVAFTAPLFTPRVVNCTICYSRGATGASQSVYGAGCQSQVASFYEGLTTPAAFDLSNSSMTLTRTNPGYSVAPGGTYVAPTGAATILALTDDSQVLTPVLTTAFPYDGGSATQLSVCSNGFVSVAVGNTTGFTPSIATFLNSPQTAWWCWHDYNPAITTAGAGRVKFEEVGPIVYITWDGVWNFGGATAATANTFQYQFNTTTGSVSYVWGAMSALGTSNFLVGYSPGGPSADPGNRDISATLAAGFAVSGSDQALALSTNTLPIPFSTIQLITTNNNPSTIFGAVLLGLTSFPGGIPLAGIGMPGCFQYNDGIASTPLFFGGAATQVLTFGIPNAPGLHIFAQSAIYCPAANLTPLGAVSSNGLDLGIGHY